MTRHDEMLAETALREVQGLGTKEAVRRLFELGLISRRECERQAIRHEMQRLERKGMPRCEAMAAAAGKYCCSYEKARNAFYTYYKHKS